MNLDGSYARLYNVATSGDLIRKTRPSVAWCWAMLQGTVFILGKGLFLDILEHRVIGHLNILKRLSVQYDIVH